MANETPVKTDVAVDAPQKTESTSEIAPQTTEESTPKATEKAAEPTMLPVSYPTSILYAQGDALAACRKAKEVLAHPESSEPGAPTEEDRKNAALFLQTVGTDRMTKIVVITSLIVVFVIILTLYVF